MLRCLSTPERIPLARTSRRHAGMPGLVAAVIIAVQALGCAAFAVLFLLAAPKGASLSDASHLVFSLLTLVFAIGLAVVARGLWRGERWPQTATVVWLVVLLPVGWAMLQAGRGLVGVLLLGGGVVGIGSVVAESRGAARP